MKVYFNDGREFVGTYERLQIYEVSEEEGLRLIETKGFLIAKEPPADTNMKHEEHDNAAS